MTKTPGTQSQLLTTLNQAVTARFKKGHKKYGNAWASLLGDRAYLQGRLLHLHNHLLDYLSGNSMEDNAVANLAAVAWGIGLLLEAHRRNPDLDLLGKAPHGK
ncbi:MAG: hypothetical protein ACREKE_07865 [bacterium]